jgi:plastocyanin
MKNLILITSVLFAYCSSLSAQTQHTITMGAMTFIPANMSINEGDEIIWSNTSSNVHTSTSGTNCTSDGLWDSGNINPGATFSRVFSAAGTYPYYCIYHCSSGMTGTITVQQVTGTIQKAENSSLKISKVFPNPVEDFTILEYTLKNPSKVKIEIVNNTGMVVKTFSPENTAGENRFSMNLSDLPSGIYYCFLISDNAERIGTTLTVR